MKSMTASRRCLLAAISFLGVFSLYSLHNLHKKYQNNTRLCERQNNLIPNATCTTFSRHRRRDAFKGIFRRWVAFAERHNITYALACGSLLGQYRNQDIIFWDGDIDVYVDVEHYDNLKRLGQPRNFREASDDVYRFVVQPEFNVRREREPRRWSCNGQEVKRMLDLCSFAGPMARFVQRHDCVDVFAMETRNGVVYDDEERISYDYSDIYPFVDCNFMGIRTKCPKNSKAVLKRYFGSLKPLCQCVDGKWMITDWW